MHAAYEGHLEIVHWLMAHGAQVNDRVVDTTPLMAASMASHREERFVLSIVQTLLNNGAILNTADRSNRTAFMYLVRNGYEQVVRYVIDQVALDAVDNDGHTALFYAIEKNHSGLVDLLIKNGCDTKVVNNVGATLRHYAIETGFGWTDEFFPEDYQYVVPSEFMSMSRPNELAPTVFPNPNV